MKQTRPVILASGSPRRKDLLSRAGVEFTIRTAEVDESTNQYSTPREAVMGLAERKAAAVYEAYGKGTHSVIIGADTLVSLGKILLGKPEDEDHARDMLQALSGRTHQVQTGVCIIFPSGMRLTFCDRTDVTFRELEPEEIDAYIATKEPMDKAGAYAIQGGAAPFISKIRGDYNNVVGFPIDHVISLLTDFGLLTETEEV